MIRSVCAGALAAGLFAGSAYAGLYGVASFSNFGVQSLYAIDQATGSATVIGSTGLRQIVGLDYDTAGGRLLALTAAGDTYQINISTGASTLVVDGSFGVPEGAYAFQGGTGYTTLFDNLQFWTGSAWQEIGPSGLAPGSDISGIDFGNGLLLGLATNGADPDSLVSFNPLTGAATFIGLTGTNSGAIADLTYDFLSGSWLLSDGANLYTVDPTTGAASLLGAHGVSGLSGLAFVPTPGSIALLALGGLVAARRRR